MFEVEYLLKGWVKKKLVNFELRLAVLNFKKDFDLFVGISSKNNFCPLSKLFEPHLQYNLLQYIGYDRWNLNISLQYSTDYCILTEINL